MITGKLYEPCDNSYCIDIATGKSAGIVQNVNVFYEPDDLGPFRIVSEPYRDQVEFLNNTHFYMFINVKSESTGKTYRTLYNDSKVEEPTEIKIVVPEGMEIDKENSTFECIKFKPKGSITYEEISKKLFKGKHTYWIGSKEILSKPNYEGYTYNDGNLMPSRKQAEKLLALNKLFNVAQYLNSKVDNFEGVFIIMIEDNDIRIYHTLYDNAYGLPTFKTEELAKQAIEILREDTIKLALSKL